MLVAYRGQKRNLPLSAIAENTHDDDLRSVTQGRWAVSAAFFANGFIVGHWAPKIPVLVERLGISESMLGVMIILFGVGALIALIAGAYVVTKTGSVPVVRWTSLLMVPSMILLTLAPTVLTTALAMLWLGMFLGAMDNAMNANGVGVEVALKKPVMSSYHGFWSLGGVAGGLTGGAMIVWLGEMGHAVAVSLMTAVVVLWAWPRYVKLDDPSDASVVGDKEISPRKQLLPKSAGIYALGVMALLGFAPEGTVIDWSALYLRDELNAPVIVSGYAVAAFSFTMAIMRFGGDGLRARFGDRRMFIASGIIAGIGMAIAGLAGTFALACVGFLVAGIGMANIVPIIFSAAGDYPGIKPSIGIAIATAFGYSGLLFIPAFVGFVAEWVSIGFVYALWSGIIMVMGLIGFVLPNLERHNSAAR